MPRPKRILTEQERDALRGYIESGMGVARAAKTAAVPVLLAIKAAKEMGIGAKPGPRMALLRRCGTCGEQKPISEFTRNSTQPGGRGYRCKLCDRARRVAFLSAPIQADPIKDLIIDDV